MKTDNARSTNVQHDSVLQESLADGAKVVDEVTRHAQASLAEAGVAARVLVDQGLGAARKSAVRVEDAAVRIGDRASLYVQEQPLKSLLIATAAGALVAIIAGMASRR